MALVLVIILVVPERDPALLPTIGAMRGRRHVHFGVDFQIRVGEFKTGGALFTKGP